MHYKHKSAYRNICITCAASNPAFYIVKDVNEQPKQIKQFLKKIKPTPQEGDLVELCGDGAGDVYLLHEAHDEDFNFPRNDACADHDTICDECRKRCCTHRTPDRMLYCWMCHLIDCDIDESLRKLRKNAAYCDEIKNITSIDILDKNLRSIDIVTYAKKIMKVCDTSLMVLSDIYQHDAVIEYLSEKYPPLKQTKTARSHPAHSRPSTGNRQVQLL